MSRAAAPWWRGRVAPAGLLLSLTLGSCGRANDDAVGDGAAGAGGVLAAPLPSFDEVRQRWSADGQEGIFSLAWQEYPEEVLFVHAGAYFGRGEESCAVYEEDSYLEGSSRYSSWFMQLYLSEAKPGVYAVRPQDTVGAPPTVQVLVYRFERGELRELHTAISGELEVSGFQPRQQTGIRALGSVCAVASNFHPMKTIRAKDAKLQVPSTVRRRSPVGVFQPPVTPMTAPKKASTTRVAALI